MKKIMAVFIVAMFAIIPTAAFAAEPDVVYFNGKITTLDAAETMVEAVAVKDGKFLSIGSAEEIKKLAGPRQK